MAAAATRKQRGAYKPTDGGSKSITKRPTDKGVQIGARIRALRLEKDWTQTELARESKLTQQNVHSYESGKNNNPRFLNQIAKALDTTVEYLIDGVSQAPGGGAEIKTASRRNQIPVIGSAAAGRWIEPHLLDPPVFIPAADNPKYANVSEQYALRVEGPSMDRHLRDGSVAKFVPYAKYGPVSGKPVHVIVRRGQFEEWTIKTLKMGDKGKVELWPESNDKRFQEPFVFDPKHPDDDVTVEIRGLLIENVSTY